ncbi:Guanylate cyclase 32E [Halotydeus destructor]|nr:Guanylate cyclase 32E [Halotydeus destructor]
MKLSRICTEKIGHRTGSMGSVETLQAVSSRSVLMDNIRLLCILGLLAAIKFKTVNAESLTEIESSSKPGILEDTSGSQSSSSLSPVDPSFPFSTISYYSSQSNSNCIQVKDDGIIKIGYLTAVSGKRNPKRQGLVISGAISYAVEQINSQNSSLLGNRKLQLVYNDTQGETLTSTKAMLDQWRQGVQAWFGPEDSCIVEATIAASLNLPLITYKCADSRVSRSEFYSTFARTFPSDIQVIRSVISLLDYFNWNKFSVIHENSDQYKTVATSLISRATKGTAEMISKFKVNSKRTFENFYLCCEERRTCCMNPFLDIIEETYRGTRIYVFIGRESDLIKMMLVLRMRGLLDHGEYMVLFIDLEPYSYEQSYKYFYGSSMTSQDKMAMQEAARSLLVIVPSSPTRGDYEFFEDQVRDYNLRPPFNFTEPFENKLNMKKHITLYASYLYDAVMLYAQAASEVLRDGLCINNGREIIDRIISKKRYKSVTGAIMKIDEKGEVEGPYTVLSLQPSKGDLPFKGILREMPFTMSPVGHFEYDETRNETKLTQTGLINWVGKRAPLMEPPCGYDGSACRAPEDNRREIFAGVVGGLFVTLSIISAVTYRNWKYEQEIAGLLWNIQKKDIQFYSGGMQLAPSRISLASNVSGDFYTPRHTLTAMYRGSEIAVKELRFTKRVDVMRETKKEMKLMKEIHHDNINPFIGACIEPNTVSIFTEYCAKGSLANILENEDIKLDLMFIASLCFDLINAMIFLHDTELRYHGNLKSSNCLITSRWVLRVTDFGVHQLRNTCDPATPLQCDYVKCLLWKAPELLRNTNTYGSPKGDVYAFAIIFHELLARQGPFGLGDDECQLTASEVVFQVQEPHDETEPFRPRIDHLQYQSYILWTMCDCWHEVPERRPDFRSIKQRLKKMRQGLKSNIMDNMMSMMERYANNLETLVSERTAAYLEEKRKAEDLLYELLPKSIAVDLIQNGTAAAEAYDCVTIYFSDIVGFTSLSAQSTPMQVVCLLNDLYTLFDSILASFDVYKIETIGDAYMVVSGLPERNGNLHAREIARFALALLNAVHSFRIRHRPEEQLKLRIGLHTGPCVAGVVGIKMPRYCLFGDTVNTASRMESTGLPLQIHLSPTTKEVLDTFATFQTELRGDVEMKGKGIVTTYWLLGEKGQDGGRKLTVPFPPTRTCSTIKETNL